MIDALAIALAVLLVASNIAWLIATDRKDRRHLDMVSEMSTRIQHPELVTPRVATDWTPPDNGEQPFDERDLAGTIQHQEYQRPEPE